MGAFASRVLMACWSVCHDHVRVLCRLDYPGIGPEHSWLKDTCRAEYYAVTDRQALEAFQLLARLEGIIPALEPAHAFAYLNVRRRASLHVCASC